MVLARAKVLLQRLVVTNLLQPESLAAHCLYGAY